MTEYIEIELNDSEKDALLDKLLRFMAANKFENIYCATTNERDLYHASFVDTDGIRIHLYTFKYIEESTDKYLKNTSLALLFGKLKIKIAITWGHSFAHIELEKGSMYDKVNRIIEYISPICTQKIKTEIGRLLK